MEWKTLATLMCVPITIALISHALTHRYLATPLQPYGAIILDSWTGNIRYCEPADESLECRDVPYKQSDSYAK